MRAKILLLLAQNQWCTVHYKLVMGDSISQNFNIVKYLKFDLFICSPHHIPRRKYQTPLSCLLQTKNNILLQTKMIKSSFVKGNQKEIEYHFEIIS